MWGTRLAVHCMQANKNPGTRCSCMHHLSMHVIGQVFEVVFTTSFLSFSLMHISQTAVHALGSQSTLQAAFFAAGMYSFWDAKNRLKSTSPQSNLSMCSSLLMALMEEMLQAMSCLLQRQGPQSKDLGRNATCCHAGLIIAVASAGGVFPMPMAPVYAVWCISHAQSRPASKSVTSESVLCVHSRSIPQW